MSVWKNNCTEIQKWSKWQNNKSIWHMFQCCAAGPAYLLFRTLLPRCRSTESTEWWPVLHTILVSIQIDTLLFHWLIWSKKHVCIWPKHTLVSCSTETMHLKRIKEWNQKCKNNLVSSRDERNVEEDGERAWESICAMDSISSHSDACKPTENRCTFLSWSVEQPMKKR